MSHPVTHWWTVFSARSCVGRSPSLVRDPAVRRLDKPGRAWRRTCASFFAGGARAGGGLSLSRYHECNARTCRCEAFERSVLSPVPHVLRHTFASNALAAGVGTFELARVMGTSLEMIERTYGHVVRGADEAFRSRLDAFSADRVGVEWASSAEGDSR